MIVDEDIVHVETPMGLIGIRIRIARKEKYIPEFEFKGKTNESKITDMKIKKSPDEEIKKSPDEEIKKSPDEDVLKAETESEIVKIEEAKIKEINSMEEEEKMMK